MAYYDDFKRPESWLKELQKTKLMRCSWAKMWISLWSLFTSPLNIWFFKNLLLDLVINHGF